jgi:KDO2-lipid IV(A) lauroyltransferase
MFLPPRVRGFLRRYVLYPLQALAAALLYGLFALLPLDLASTAGGRLGRAVGPWLAVSRRAERNLGRAFPDKTAAEIAAVVAGMWDNLGRTFAEFPHLAEIYAAGRVDLRGIEHIEALRDDGKPGLFFAAHLGNWELAAFGAHVRGVRLHLVYRAANNVFVQWLYGRRLPSRDAELIPKGAQGARRVLELLKKGEHVGMLVDQKMNDGIPAPFFGRDAMTAPALAQFGLKFGCPVVPARVERLGGARFRVTAFPPLELVRTGDRHADIAANTARVNALIEGWIRERPEQWLWVHNRWPD